MNRVFNLNGPAMQFMLFLRDLIVLNILFLLTCIPIITIGPSITALFCVTFQMAENKENYVARQYIHALKENMKKSLAAECIIILPMLLLGFNLFFWSSFRSIAGTIMSILCIIFLLLLAGMLCFVFPLIAKFENTIRQTLHNAIFFVTSYKGYTLALIALLLLEAFLLILTTITTTLMLFFGFSFFSYVDATILLKLLKRFYEDTDKEKAEANC